MLTQKQENYIQGLLQGLSQRKAYRKAYPKSENWKDETVDVRACELLKNSKVLVRYKELKDREEKIKRQKNLWSYEESVKGLLWIMGQSQLDIKERGFRQGNSKAFIDALRELNKLEGYGKERETKIELDRARIDKIRQESINIESSQEEKLADILESMQNAVD